MTRVRARGEEIRRFILENVQSNPNGVSKLAAEHFGISRQAVNGHMNRLVADGSLREKGVTRSKAYELAPQQVWQQLYQLSQDPSEDRVWRTDIAPTLGLLPENVQKIWNFGFTEMFNNAIDHSEGKQIFVHIAKTAISTEMAIMDDGIGIFRKIQNAMGLLDERHAIFELAKGKLTTDPSRHSGEGIFFTSRAFDAFDILSGGVFYSHEFGKDEDWLSELSNPSSGTTVFLRLSNHSSRTMKQLYAEFEKPEAPGFTKTVVPVRLAQYGNDQLVSRSQAKRVMARVELFSTVIMNFENVASIGQAFADEVFRVFANAHPGIDIVPINTNEEVTQMITRAQQAAKEDRGAVKPTSGEHDS